MSIAPIAPDLPLFVYGTLRRGCSNDIAMLVPSSVWLGAARVCGRLYCVGWYPHLIIDSSADWVIGELVDVPAESWKTLDTLEEIVTPTRADGEYFKRTCTVRADAGDVQAIIYEGNPAVLRTDELIADGDWAAYAVARGITRFAR